MLITNHNCPEVHILIGAFHAYMIKMWEWKHTWASKYLIFLFSLFRPLRISTDVISLCLNSSTPLFPGFNCTKQEHKRIWKVTSAKQREYTLMRLMTSWWGTKGDRPMTGSATNCNYKTNRNKIGNNSTETQHHEAFSRNKFVVYHF